VRSADSIEDGEIERAIWSFQLERSLPVKTGTIGKITAEPMEADAVGAGTFDPIHHNPEVVLEEKYRSPVNAVTRMPLVAVVLAHAESPISVVLKAQ
jgi:hypothetical protein